MSRASTDDPVTDEVAINNVTLTAFIPDRLDRIRGATLLDPVLQELGVDIMERRVSGRLLLYFSYRDELTIQDMPRRGGVFYRGPMVMYSCAREHKYIVTHYSRLH